jgi:hypothetical protein
MGGEKMVGFPRPGILALLGALSLPIVVAGCGDSSEPSQTVQTTQVSQTLQTSETTPNSQVTQSTAAVVGGEFTRENWGELASDPDAHKGARVDIVGRLLQAPVRRDDGSYWQMYADPKNYDWATSVHFPDPSFPVATDDFVHVTGTVQGALEGESAFGEMITLVSVLAETAEVVDVMAAASPTRRTVTVDQSIDQHGIAVTIEKVEFAADETRVFVKVVNESAATADLYDLQVAAATQDGTEYEAERLWDYYPSVEWELPPGLESAGIIVFPAMASSRPVEVRLEAGSDDYGLSFEPYVFEVPVE